VDEVIDRAVFSSPIVTIGAFRCGTDHPSFEDAGLIESECCFVFPRNSVVIETEHERPFVSNLNTVTFYNRGQHYRRRAISVDGDRCDWFALPARLVRSAICEFDPRGESRPEHPFPLTHGCSDPATYLAQRQLFTLVCARANVAPLWVEEQVVLLLGRILRRTFKRAPAYPLQRDALHYMEVLLSERWDRTVRLSELAMAAEMSEFHLCRSFRKFTGLSLHQYQLRLRLRYALESVCESRQSLVDLALGVGFSSHSHFTSAFRGEFRRTPSSLRARQQDFDSGDLGRNSSVDHAHCSSDRARRSSGFQPGAREEAVFDGVA
jgi:AraC-like DNA-binding protein